MTYRNGNLPLFPDLIRDSLFILCLRQYVQHLTHISFNKDRPLRDSPHDIDYCAASGLCPESSCSGGSSALQRPASDPARSECHFLFHIPRIFL